jgi:hypothetical protein
MSRPKDRIAFDWLALWILFATWSSLSGWFLSYLKGLNVVGVGASYVLFAGFIFLVRAYLYDAESPRFRGVFGTKFLLPKIWLVLVLLALIGGAVYSPNNYDYLTYRFPRVLNWSWEHGWFWIPTVNARINYSGSGFEWLMVPLFIVFKTDRLFFLINFISYLFLPSLVFSVFSSLGISKRISWWWMWVLPAGYCYILQAASAGNDSFAAVYFLASLHYVFRAKTTPSLKNLALSCFAIALMTAAKASNLPLVLPWAVVAAFQSRTLIKPVRVPVLALIMMIAAAVSFLPTACLNIHFTGDFAGDPKNSERMKLSNPLIGIAGNGLQIAQDNLVPPILPGSINWSRVLPSDLKATLKNGFPRLNLESDQLQMEENAGPGLGVVLFAGVFVFFGIAGRRMDSREVVRARSLALSFGCATVIALLAYMSKMGSESTSRLIAAYYPALIAAILAVAALDGRIVHKSLIQWTGCFSMLSAIPLLILSPARPLFPVQLVGNLIAGSHLSQAFETRFNDVYAVYAARADVYKDLLASLPPDERTVGFVQIGNDSEAPLWRPFGARRIVEVSPLDSADKIKAQQVRYVVLGQFALTNAYHSDLNAVMSNWSASLVTQKKITLTAHRGLEDWYVLRLQP